MRGMAWLLGVDPASLGVEIPSMCNNDLKVEIRFLGKKVCDVCHWDEVCDLVIGAVDLKPLSELLFYLRNFNLSNDQAMDLVRQAVEIALENIFIMLGLGPTQFKVVHKINDLPQFAPRDTWQIDGGQLIFKSPADLMRIGIYFAAGDGFDPDEFIAFNNLVKYALYTSSIRAILMFKGLDPYGPSDDYVWVIVYDQGTGGDGA